MVAPVARRALVGLVVTGAVLAGVGASSHEGAAAGLGGLRSANLTTQQFAGAGTFDSFNYPPGTTLSSVTDRCGDTWTVNGGTFVVTDQGTTVSSTGASLVTATVPVCGTPGPQLDVSVDMLSIGSSLFGVLMHADSSGRPATLITYTNSGAGTVQVWRIAADGTRTEVAAARQTGGGFTNRTLRASYRAGTYRVYLNEVLELTYTVPAAQQAGEATPTRVGIAALGDQRSTFDNFQAWPS